MMESLADAGNGNYTYIDSKETMKRFFVDEMTNTLEVIASDAKIQVEWNPEVVRTFRLLGYENRALTTQDFRNDKKDAGEIGAGHAVTAIYEIERTGAVGKVGTVRVRHKVPRHEHASEESVTIASVSSSTDALDADAQTALGMALGAEILRGSEHAAGLTLKDAAKLLRAGARGPHAAERNEAAELFERAPATPIMSVASAD
ncbi:MAG TPA: YfbK domain-containing protein, partial [Myxococcota bacterium]